MIEQLKTEQKSCSHCNGRTICDCSTCGQKVRFIDFGGKWHKFYESGKCKICDGKGSILNSAR
jgi:hypothetical protein